jgi:hypothetical protein
MPANSHELVINKNWHDDYKCNFDTTYLTNSQFDSSLLRTGSYKDRGFEIDGFTLWEVLR